MSRTLAQQLAPAVEKATAPFHYALTTRAGCECIGHILQVETDSSPERTVLSVDGIGAFDLVSRESMLRGLFSVQGGEAVLPFVRQFYGVPSTYLWQDDSGDIHEIHQGEGGEQGDALMPALFCLGQHNALAAVQQELVGNERLFAFLDDIYVTCSPGRVVPIFNTLRRELWMHSRIQIHLGKTQVWNRGGVEPPGWQRLAADAQASDPDAVVWRGDHTSSGESRVARPWHTSRQSSSRRKGVGESGIETASASGQDSPRLRFAVRLVAPLVLRIPSSQLHPEDVAPLCNSRVRDPPR